MRLYVERKQSLGFHFEAAIHRSLLRTLGDMPLRSITPRQIGAFLNGPRTGNSGWHQKYETVERFFRFWVLRGKLKRVPMPPTIPRQPITFGSYIYSRAELRRLQCRTRQKTALSVRHRPRNVVGLLALSLRNRHVGRRGRGPCMKDINFSEDTITDRSPYPHRTRVIPIGPAVRKLLADYLRSPVRQKHGSANVFVNDNGEALSRPTLVGRFQKLRTVANVSRHRVNISASDARLTTHLCGASADFVVRGRRGRCSVASHSGCVYGA